jgi:hypothetical protein
MMEHMFNIIKKRAYQWTVKALNYIIFKYFDQARRGRTDLGSEFSSFVRAAAAAELSPASHN